MNVPLLNLTRQHQSIQDELNQAWQQVVENSAFILGEPVATFEKQVAEYHAMPHAVGVASGTDALILAMQALGIGPGDAVLTVPFTFVATASSIMRVGAVPVFVDIEPNTFNISVESLKQALTSLPAGGPKPKAIIPVHLFGLPADMDAIRELAQEHNLLVVEDAAQAFGAKYKGHLVGKTGDAGCLSYFPSKNLGGMGDGGMVLTHSDETAERVRWLRQHGGKNKYVVDLLGYNSRLDALQAKLLSIKLGYVDQWNSNRRANAEKLCAGLKDLDEVKTPAVPEYAVSVFNQYTIRCRRRDELAEHLKQKGIGSAVYYPQCLHQQNLFKETTLRPVSLTHSEQACGEVLSLPIDPLQTPEETQFVIDGVRKFYGKNSQ